MTSHPLPHLAGPGQESVWSYPRPPAVLLSDETVVVESDGIELARSERPHRVLETSHAPVYYLPRQDVRMQLLRINARSTWCEFKGRAGYFDLVLGDRVVPSVAWTYHNPSPGYEELAGAIAFYPERVDRCLVDGEEVVPVDGSFYGGWVTSRVVGPFKGGSGTDGW